MFKMLKDCYGSILEQRGPYAPPAQLCAIQMYDVSDERPLDYSRDWQYWASSTLPGLFDDSTQT